MPFEKNYDEKRPVRGDVCIHLRTKAMYVFGEIKNPDHPEEAGAQHCWCNVTQHVIGPDQRHVDRHACLQGRDCFRDSY
jgi:hypothetical protein